MRCTKKIMRGLQDIRTMSGRVDDRAAPYKSYMKLSILEMEKYRRGKEKQSALEKVRNIEERFRDIEAEKREIIDFLESQGVHRKRMQGPGGPAPSRTGLGPFKIRY
jgi:hypothetical protein